MLNDAGIGVGDGVCGRVLKIECGFRCILEKRVSHTLRPSRVSFPYHCRLWADQIRCPGTFQRGRPPPPGPEQGFLLSPGETASPGTPGFHSSVGGRGGKDQAKPAEADLHSGPPETTRNKAKTNIVEDQLLPALSPQIILSV